MSCNNPVAVVTHRLTAVGCVSAHDEAEELCTAAPSNEIVEL